MIFDVIPLASEHILRVLNFGYFQDETINSCFCFAINIRVLRSGKFSTLRIFSTCSFVLDLRVTKNVTASSAFSLT